MWLEVLLIIFLVLLNGLFAGAEIATVTLRKTRIEQLLLEGRRGAKAIAELRAQPERFLATVQIGITLVGAAAAAYGGDTFAEHLTPLLSPTLGDYAHEVALILIIITIAYLSLVLGELVPKSLALRTAERYALLVASPLLTLAKLARPLVWVLTKSSNAVLKVFGDSTSFTEARISPDELKAMLEDAGEEGALHPRIGEIASRAMDFGELRAVDVMVPRSRIHAISEDASVEDLRRFVIYVAHSRIPLFSGAIDRVTGYVSVRDAFTNLDGHTKISALLRPITFVPESMRAVDILHTLQSRGAEIAIVADEHGGTAGLLTREDLAEELFGEATAVETVRREELIHQELDGSHVVVGSASVREVNRVLDLELPESDDWTTVAGLCVALAGHIPTKGTRVRVPNGPLIEILDASPRRVRAVRLMTAAQSTK
jgi:putative hemolysin